MADKDFWSQFDSIDANSKTKSVEHEHLDKMRNKSALSKAANFVQPFNNFIQKTRLPEAAGGVIQNTLNTGASILNAPLEAINSVAGTDYQVPYVDYSSNVQQDPLSQSVFKGSELASNIGSGLGAYKALNKIPGMIGNIPIKTKIGQGALSGYLTGGNNNGESAYDIPDSRLINAGIGAGLSGAGQLTNDALMKKIASQKENVENISSNAYQNFINKAENSNDNGLNIKNYIKTKQPYDKKLLTDLFTKDQRRALEDFYENRTFSSAHLAQSEIGSKIRKIKESVDKGSMTAIAGDKKIEKLNDIKNDIKLGMSKFLYSKNPSFLDEYNKLGSDYLKNVVPYKDPNISSYIKGEKYSDNTLKNLLNNRQFMESAGKDISGLGTRKMINKGATAVKYGLIPAYFTWQEAQNIARNK